MATAEPLKGFKVYREYGQRASYRRNAQRRLRNRYVVEALFGNDHAALPNSKIRALNRRLDALQEISDGFFHRVKLEPDVLAAFKNVLGSSFEHGTIDHEAFLSSQKASHFSLIRLLFTTLSHNYDRILELEGQVHVLTDENFHLNAYVADVQDEMDRLRMFASDCNELRVSELGIQSEEYQILYEKYLGLQRDLELAQLNAAALERRLAEETELTAKYEKGRVGSSAQEDAVTLDNLPPFFNKINLFEPVMDDNQVLEYENKLAELRKSNERLVQENTDLRRASGETFGAEKFVTLSLLMHQITKSLNKLFRPDNERRRSSGGSDALKNLDMMLYDSRVNTLEYENRTYKDRLLEVEELLKNETVDRFSLESVVSQLKMDVHQSQQVYLKMEALNTTALKNQHELDLVRSNRDVFSEQLGRMKHMVTTLTQEKHELSAKLFSLEYSKDSLLKELEVLKEQLHKMETLLMDRDADKFDFRDKITNIQLQANAKILEDKLVRVKMQMDEVKLENTNLVTSMVDLRNNLERERRENSDLLKKVSAALKNESKFTTDVQRLVAEVNSLKASLETSALNMRNMSNEMGLMTRRLFEKDLQLSSLEAKKDKATGLMNEVGKRLSTYRVQPVNLDEVKNLDLKTVNYSELIQLLTSTTQPGAEGHPSRESSAEDVMRDLGNLVTFNQLLVGLCVNLSKQLSALSANMLNVTNFSNIYDTFKMELVDVDAFKNESMLTIKDLENKLENMERLNSELAEKHVWDKSVVRLKDKYEGSLSNYKLMLKECRHLLKLNENALDSLRNENARLLSDCSGAANVMVEYENKLSESTQELLQLKELIFTILPNELKMNANKETPLKSLELLTSYYGHNAAFPNPLNLRDTYSNGSLVVNLSSAGNERVSSGVNLSQAHSAAGHVGPAAEERANVQSSPFSASAADKTARIQPVARDADMEDEVPLEDRERQLSHKQQQLNDVYDDVEYYCNLIVGEIKSHLSSDRPPDTDYESTNSNHDVLSDDTVTERDEDYVVDRFEEILNLLNKLYYHHSYNARRSFPQTPLNQGAAEGSTLVLDMNVIKCINKFVDTLKRYCRTFNTQNLLALDDLEYQFEAIPTMLDNEAKLRSFCCNLTKLLNLAGDFVYEQLNENSESMTQMMRDLQENAASIQKLEQVNLLKEKQIKSSQFEINDLKMQLNQLQHLYHTERNQNQEAAANMDKCEREVKRLREDLAEKSLKNEKLLLLVGEYQQIVKLLKT